jgi:phospholipid/cholesterol/gamma-HCH transport system ATP-binding protein
MSGAPEHVITIRGLVNRFGRQVVHDGLDLDVRRDEVLAVVGGSGTGKSVLLRSILGLHEPSAGTITVLGQEIRYLEPGPHKQWGVLFQGGALLSGLTVQENVELPIALHSDLPVETRRELAVLKIFMVGLDLAAAAKYPNELSGGMRKRAGLARALALEPRILFLDEPTAGLDPISATEFDELIGTCTSISTSPSSSSRTTSTPCSASATAWPCWSTRASSSILWRGSCNIQTHGSRSISATRARSGPGGGREPMFKGDRNFTVGLFVSVAIAVFVLFVIWLTGRSGQEAMTRYTLMFERDVSGLAIGGPVKYMGMNIGSVIHMDLDTSQGVRVQVDIEILRPPRDTALMLLALQGITGVAVVNLASAPGTHPPLPEPERGQYPRIPVRDVGFAALISSAPAIMSKLDQLLTRAGELLGEENSTAVGNALQNVETLSAALAGSSDRLAALPQELSATLAGIQAAVDRLQGVIAQLQPDLSATAANLKNGSENLAALTGRFDELLRRHEDDMSRFIEDGLGEAPALMQEMRQALRELEKLMAELQENPSQLIHRPPSDVLEIDP